MAASGQVSSALSASPAGPATIPAGSRSLPLSKRFYYASRLWLFKTLVVVALKLLRLVKASQFSKIAPDYTKRYSVRPMLESRVFIPKNAVKGTKLPLYMDIHGGGFALCDPATDDFFCRRFADEFGYCVVSLDYRKAPSYPFPIPVHDCAELARAVLADKTLPVDYERVVLGGFSAGGNLSLAVAQFEDLKPRISAVVPIYPVTDFTRTYRGEYRPTKDGREDVLKQSSELFNWGYVSPEIDRRDTLLSCCFATRKELPQKMYFVGAEYDCLCNEANFLAKKLAGIEHEPDLGPSWNKNGIRWEMVPDLQHGFTHMEERGKKEVERQRIMDGLWQRIDAWIKQEVFQI